MRKYLGCWVMAAAAVSGGAVQAQVVAKDLDGDGRALTFLDAAHGLYWSVPGVVPADVFAIASTAVDRLVLEGRNDWRLPTQAEFQALYATQGQTGSAMKTSPFPTYATWYWTTNVFTQNTLQNLAFAPANGASMPYFRTTDVGVWAVSTVPEPATPGLAAVGLLGLAAWRRLTRRQAETC